MTSLNVTTRTDFTNRAERYTSDQELLLRAARELTAAGEREAGLREALNDAECDLSAADAENERLRQALRFYATARAALASAQADVEATKLKLKQTRVVAADDGVVSSKSAVLGNVVNAGAEPVPRGVAFPAMTQDLDQIGAAPHLGGGVLRRDWRRRVEIQPTPGP